MKTTISSEYLPNRSTQKSTETRRTALWLGVPLALVWGLLNSAKAQNAFLQHNLVSNVPGLADVTDTNLVNPWGIAFSATSPFWISDNHAGVSTLYNSSGTPQSLIVNIPPPAGGTPPAAPTGIIFNGTTGFTVASNAPARFIFATEDGTISGWNSGTNAILKVDNSAAGTVYQGLATGSSSGSNFIYATDFHGGKIDVFNTNYSPVTLAGSFADGTIPASFAPFGIQNLNGQLYVTYAKQDADKHDDVAGAGNGYVNVFDTSGHLVTRLVSGGVLNSPWGLAMAPSAFGAFGGALLVGNFGDGRINAFNPTTGALLGTLNDTSNNPVSIAGLWALAIGNGGSGGDAHTLYFTAGIPYTNLVEDHGLFGSLTAVVPTFTSDTNRGLVASLTWAGGVGPFVLQEKTSVAGSNWLDVLTTPNHNALVAKDDLTGFFRLQNQPSNTVASFTVLLSGANEFPATTATNATGVGTLSLEYSNLSYHITFSGLSAPATASHIHSPGSATNSASVSVPFSGVPAATAGTISGTVVMTPAQIADMVNGFAYVNIHTTNNPNGEIRGQIVPLHFPITLNGASEIPAPTVPTTATGTGSLTLVGSQLYYDISYSGLTSAANAAHIHGPADATNPAAVLIPLATPSGTSGTISGTVSLSPTNLAYLLAGLTYVNIHSASNSNGEIRGQIYPVQLAATLNGASEVGPTTSPGTSSGSMTLLNSVLNYSFTFTNLLSAATGAHIHGPADTTHNASVIIPFAPPAATSGTISGTTNLTAQQVMWLVTGQTYANIHTTNNPGGEIRGQVLPRN